MADNEKGLYFASTMSRMLLSNLPGIIWGPNPHSAAAKLMTWVAPAASGMMGMFINNKMREDAVAKNTKGLDDIRDEMHTLEANVRTIANSQSSKKSSSV